MPKLKNGLYRNPGSRHWSYHFRFRGKVYKGSTRCASQADAKVWVEAYKKHLNDEAVGTAKKPVPTLAVVLKAWREAETGSLTPKHLDDRRDTLEDHCGPVLDLPLDQLTMATLDSLRSTYLSGEWRAPNWAEGVSRSRTAGGWNRVRRHLLALCRWAVERELLDEVPFRGKPLPRTTPPKTVIWTEQWAPFLAAVDQTRSLHAQAAVRLMLLLGLREDEALGARWEWLDPVGQVYWVGDPKDLESRPVDLPPGLADWLTSHLERKPSGLLLPGTTEDDQEAPHVQGFTRKAIERGGRTIQVAGLGPHSLRRSFATAHWEAGTSVQDITALLGHASVETTITSYIVPRGRSRAEAQKRLSELAFGKPLPLRYRLNQRYKQRLKAKRVINGSSAS